LFGVAIESSKVRLKTSPLASPRFRSTLRLATCFVPGTVSPESSASELVPPPVAQYELLRRIGQGSYGDVWLARGVTGVLWAVKIVWRNRFADPAPFDREFRGLSEFATMPLGGAHHLAIAHVGKNEELGFFYYVMELADDIHAGRAIHPARYAPLTLSSLRQQRGRLPAAECISIATDLARGLAHLHERGLVHRDIKPSNVVFVGNVPKLADIGLLAKVNDAATFVGTEGYIPPEGPGTMSADVFGLGKLLYELTTGMDRKHFPRLPPSLAELPDRKALLELNEIILRACAPSPAERYANAGEILEDLTILTAGKSLRFRSVRKRGVRLALLVGGIAAVGLLATTTLWRPRRVDQAPPTVHQAASETEQLLARVRSLTDGIYKRDAILAADKMARRATALTPQSASAWGLLAYCGACQLQRNWDVSLARREDVQASANRALAIDPNDAMALLSLAILHRRQLAHAQSELVARQGIKIHPEDPRLWRVLINAIFSQGRQEEAFVLADEAKKRFPRDALLYYELSLLYGQRNDFERFEQNIDHALAIKVFQAALITKVDVVTYRRGDLAMAEATYSQIEPEERSEDRVVGCAMYIGALRRDPARMHEAASLTASPYISDFITRGGPKAFWEAIAYNLEGKSALEREQWLQGVEVIQKLRRDGGAVPNDQPRLATALVRLGRLEEAEKEIHSYEATYREQPKAEKALMLAMYYAALADAKKAVPFLRDALNRWSGVSYPLLKLHPWWDNLRGQPEFDELLAAASRPETR
jgi:serine/threonine protein kinase